MANKTCKFCSKPVQARGMCHGHYRRWTEGKRGSALEAPIREYGMGDVDLMDDSGSSIARLQYDKEWESFCKWIGIEHERKARIPEKPKGNELIGGVISDPHIPFHDMPALVEAVEWMKSEGVTHVWVGGDAADHYSMSRFSQYESVPIQYEATEARKVFDLLSRTFAEVNVISGNHEARERKYLAARLPADLLNWFLCKSFVERITEDMPNVHVIKRIVEDTPMHWLTPVGDDLIIAHAETQSKIALRPADNVRLWMDCWHEVLSLSRPKVIMQAHTHQAGIAPIGGQMICELGCTCKIQGYALEPRLYGKPQRQAATIFRQVDGVTQINSIRQRYLGVQ